MAEEQLNKAETVKPSQKQTATANRGWKRWLNFQPFVRQFPFIVFLCVLGVLYIYNGHLADNTIRKINKTEKEVKELKYEFIHLKSEVMFLSKPGEVIKAVEPLGLKEPEQSPVILKDTVTEVAITN